MIKEAISHKKCFECNESKSLNEFYRNSKMANGLLNKCKSCIRKDVLKNRRKNIEYYRGYDRKRQLTEERKKQKLIYSKKYIKLYPERKLATMKAYRTRNPEKYAAHTIINNAIKTGNIKKPDCCSVCSKETVVEGHHHDYSKPLEVIWVCSQCHKDIHKQINNKLWHIL